MFWKRYKITNRKSPVPDPSVLVPMTLSDLDRQDVRSAVYWADFRRCDYRFIMVFHVGEGRVSR